MFKEDNFSITSRIIFFIYDFQYKFAYEVKEYVEN